jgi:DNA-3-methyladenine glycosylase I
MRPRPLTLKPPPLSPSIAHADGVRRCWGAEFSLPAMAAYHDAEWGRALPPGSGRALFRQLLLQTNQSGLSWAIILKKEPGFAARYAQYDYTAIAKWGEADIAAALADEGIVRNGLKVRAAVANAIAATALDAAEPRGFEAFCWRTLALPPAERLLQHASRSDSYMRGTDRTDFDTADGTHPTVGVARAVRDFKAAGFRFLGPATMLSFMQAAGFVNHHKPDCAAFAHAEASYAAAAAAAAAAAGAVAQAGAGAGAGAGASVGAGAGGPRRKRGSATDADTLGLAAAPAAAPKRSRSSNKCPQRVE